MAKKSIGVEVSEENALGVKTISLTITAASEEFALADLLAQRKAIPACAALLKTAATEAMKGYLESAETFVSGVKSEPKIEEPATSEEPPKRSRKNQTEPQKEKADLANLTAKAVNGEATITATAGD